MIYKKKCGAKCGKVDAELLEKYNDIFPIG